MYLDAPVPIWPSWYRCSEYNPTFMLAPPRSSPQRRLVGPDVRLGHEADVCGLIHEPMGAFPDRACGHRIVDRLFDATGERRIVVRKPSGHPMPDHVGDVAQRARD